MADQEQKAIELMAQAEKKLKSGGGFFGMFGYVQYLSLCQLLFIVCLSFVICCLFSCHTHRS